MKTFIAKDFSDKFRPGASLKVPSNVPFSKTKQRAIYVSDLAVICEVCNKRRVAYVEKKLKPQEVEDADYALKNTRYVCGGRLSSFGRSLAVLEEVASYEMLHLHLITQNNLMREKILISQLKEKGNS